MSAPASERRHGRGTCGGVTGEPASAGPGQPAGSHPAARPWSPLGPSAGAAFPVSGKRGGIMTVTSVEFWE